MSVRNGEGVPEGYNLGAVAGRAFERDRIIALLETEMCKAYGENCADNPNCMSRIAILALIKGEQSVSANPDSAAISENPDKGEQS
jgi:hypothetical protein